VHVSNPFTAQKRRDARDASIMERHHSEREAREATRQAAYQSQQRQAETAKAMGGAGRPGGAQRNLAERSKYQFEADSEDDDMENEIDDNLDQLHGAAGRLGVLAKAMGKEVETQNEHISRISNKTDNVGDEIELNRARLDRIH
jgi:protein transport protein SEC9